MVRGTSRRSVYLTYSVKKIFSFKKAMKLAPDKNILGSNGNATYVKAKKIIARVVLGDGVFFRGISSIAPMAFLYTVVAGGGKGKRGVHLWVYRSPT